MLSIILLQKEKKMEKIKALIVLMSLALSPMALAGMGHKKMKMMKSDESSQIMEKHMAKMESHIEKMNHTIDKINNML